MFYSVLIQYFEDKNKLLNDIKGPLYDAGERLLIFVNSTAKQIHPSLQCSFRSSAPQIHGHALPR